MAEPAISNQPSALLLGAESQMPDQTDLELFSGKTREIYS
jgi:hypothetical protein